MRVDELARFVAGPVAMASLGAALYEHAGPGLAAVLWTLAAVWLVASFRQWWSERHTLSERTYRVANQVRRCIPDWWKDLDYRPLSSYGLNASAARHIAELETHRKRWRGTLPRPKRRFTRRKLRSVRRVIEDMGAAHLKDGQLQRYLWDEPKPEEFEELARMLKDLAWRHDKASTS